MSLSIHPDARITPLLTLDRPMRSRSRRVILLMALLVVLDLADLSMTITHAFSFGMDEVNPIAAYLIRHGSVLGLTLFKLGTLGLTVGLLLKLRHRRIAEFASWALAAVMLCLTLHWYRYNNDLPRELANTNYSQVAHEINTPLAAVNTP